MKFIYLAIRHDRHTDDRYIGFIELEDAIIQCTEWIDEYNPSKYIFDKWVSSEHEYYAQAGGSGDYYICVRKIELIK